jgi:2-dehydropantoate 2-reductase
MASMKICIAGVGAIGTYLAARLSSGESEVSVVARSGSATSLREHGVALTEATEEVSRGKPRVFTAGEVPQDAQDWLLVCVKTYSVTEIVTDLKPLIGPNTRVVFVQNGMPWWYRVGAASSEELTPRDRVVGCVAYANVRTLRTGVAQHVGDDRFILGQPEGAKRFPLDPLIQAMRAVRVEASATDRIEREVWVKLWGNLAFNPISALTGATMDRIIAEPHTRPLVMAMMGEAQQIAAALGVDFGVTIEQRLEMATRAGAFKTSMLQDLEAGRRLEIDAILGSVSAAARVLGVKSPAIDTVLGLLIQKMATLEMQGYGGTAKGTQP